jgi:Domain of unknown function (DUF4330)
VTVLDDRGRLFGRVNLVDAVVVGFIVLLIPVAYGTWLLFRSKPVRITSVTRVTLSKEEQRIANPLRAAAKLKVKGTGFTPMLRAWIGPEPSLGFTFEGPTSADVIVGPMAPGEYDVALYDGGQEVARAPKAFVNPGIPNHDQIKAVGRLVDLNRATADALQSGAMFPSNSDARVRIAALGPVEPGRRPLLVQPGTERLDVPREGAFERSATLVLTCDPTNQPDTTCMVGGLYPSVNTALRVPGATDAMTFVVDELLPAAPAQPLDATVRLTGGPELAMVAVGDRDGLLDDRAAVVTAIRSRQGSSVDVQLRLGVDRARDGWRYRGRVVKAGAPFTLTTERYTAAGTVVSAVAASTGESR